MNAHDTSIDLAAYFERIGFSGPARPAPTLDTLRALHLLHPQTIPFENLDVLIGRPVRLDLESVQRKLVESRRGGYCYEHNLLFRSVLQTLGFRVRSFAGRVLWGRDAPEMPARTHMLLLVDLDEGTFLTDVGFGGMTLSAPLALQTGLEQITPHGAFRLDDAGGEPPAYILQALVNGAWTRVYRFDLDPQYDADYEMANYFVSAYPQSIFLHNLLAARLAPGKRFGLFNRRFSAHDEREGSDHRELESVADLRRVLENELGIRLPDDAGLDAALARLP
ncbi:arylamine N-acetyltransferase [Caballeronia novacaledonica]|jgi:N-hydroxyarylamine O-acetyltransferase|uniref:arylamine N-acetyltransferase family protein n=1 Tax=Caballeronia novacaledonica TaxID=1544861 RepID=UPI001EE39BB6|nr:arylamine N-acetyltransferase [Caballeronia novacaledonica]GJH11020.1 arylamine N-acetyltransferase [Caballeronia novacaledonica]